MKFSEECWEESASLLQSIVNQKFNQELTKGTLDIQRFLYYIEQDILFLEEYARALAIMAARGETSKMVGDFLRMAQGALVAEQEVVHEFYKKDPTYKVTGYRTPACLCYTSYLLRECTLASVGVAMAVLVPCPWVYAYIGQTFAKKPISNNRYQHWIDTYASKESLDVTTMYISYLDMYAESASINEKRSMKKAFKTTVALEYYFWEDAYNLARLEFLE
ncbi:MAG: TenA family protein [Desulfovibrionaceae bacterium]